MRGGLDLQSATAAADRRFGCSSAPVMTATRAAMSIALTGSAGQLAWLVSTIHTAPRCGVGEIALCELREVRGAVWFVE